MKGQDTPPPSRLSGNRPGQRQQERLQRLARRRRRRQRITGILVATAIIVATIPIIWLLQQYQNNQAQIANQNAAKTANVLNTQASATANVLNAQANATANVLNTQASATAQVEAATPTPVVGSPTPP